MKHLYFIRILIYLLNLDVDYYKALTLTNCCALSRIFFLLFLFLPFLVLFVCMFLSLIIKHVTNRYIPARVN